MKSRDRLLCWDWIRDKTRAPPAIDIDVVMQTAEGDRYAPEIFDAQTGIPWHKGGALPPGSYVSRFCTTLPPSLARSMPVRLRQVFNYEGLWGLWILRVPLPDILSD